MSNDRRYQVGGVDEHGDVHTYETNDRDMADGMRAQMSEDLDAVDFEDRGENQTS